MVVPKILMSSESVEWYTPPEFIDAARQVMGHIDLDPASCVEANKIVRATRIFTAEDDGLTQEWNAGSVFLNPPYGRLYGKSGPSNCDLWTAKLLDEYNSGRTKEAILLVNARTGDGWFQRLWQFPICFTRRIHFISPTGAKKQPTQGNAFVYLPYHRKGIQLVDNVDLFYEVFSKKGHVCR